jgi:hypothetical protein
MKVLREVRASESGVFEVNAMIVAGRETLGASQYARMTRAVVGESSSRSALVRFVRIVLSYIWAHHTTW